MDFWFMSNAVGKVVQVERGGPDKVEGELVGIRDDHLVLRTKEHEVIYCVSSHIKSVTEPIVTRIDLTQSELEAGTEQLPVIPIEEAASFQELLKLIQGKMVRINHGGPGMVKGVLYSVGPESISMVHEMKDYVHYPIFHIKSVSLIYEIVQNQENKEGEDKKDSEKDSERK
jgi:spore coat protein B